MVWRQKTTDLKQMKNEKITDKILHEKLENFSMPPAPQVWDNIQAQLAARKRNNRMIIIGWISAAAVLVLAFMAGWYFNDNLKTEKISSVNKEIIQSEKTTKPEFAAQPEKQGQNLTAKNINENSEKPVKITPSTELTLRKKETIGKGKEDVTPRRGAHRRPRGEAHHQRADGRRAGVRPRQEEAGGRRGLRLRRRHLRHLDPRGR